MKCPEKENLYKKKADQWFPGARGGSKDCLQMGLKKFWGVWKCYKTG